MCNYGKRNYVAVFAFERLPRLQELVAILTPLPFRPANGDPTTPIRWEMAGASCSAGRTSRLGGTCPADQDSIYLSNRDTLAHPPTEVVRGEATFLLRAAPCAWNISWNQSSMGRVSGGGQTIRERPLRYARIARVHYCLMVPWYKYVRRLA